MSITREIKTITTATGNGITAIITQNERNAGQVHVRVTGKAGARSPPP